MPIDCADAAKLIGEELFREVHELSIELYRMGVERAQSADIILADTKFEFGTDEQGELYLIDEVLTPDSSRYWPRKGYAPGGPQPSFDKQFVRDYLEGLDWDKMPPRQAFPTMSCKALSTAILRLTWRLSGTTVERGKWRVTDAAYANKLLTACLATLTGEAMNPCQFG